MCGRYVAVKDPATLAAEFDAIDLTHGRISADYNVAPTKDVPVIVRRYPRDDEGALIEGASPERSVRVMKWGLVPPWAKDPSAGSRMINTRGETAAEKPSFRKALAHRRCLVPADGWFEWQRGSDPKNKTPYYVTPRDGSLMAFAGIWEVWRSREAEEKTPLITFSILTTDAVGPLQDIHHRMPLMIAKRDREKWLDPDLTEVKGTAVDGLLAPVALSIVDELELRPVSPLVNSVRNNNVDLLRRAEPMPVELDSVELDQGSLFDVS